jgi:hypothetical protein
MLGIATFTIDASSSAMNCPITRIASMVPLPELSAAAPEDPAAPEDNEVDVEAAAVVELVMAPSVQAEPARYQSLFILVPPAPGTSVTNA